MAQNGTNAPHVAPDRPKGSGRRAPWVALALLMLIGVTLLISIGVAVLILRG